MIIISDSLNPMKIWWKWVFFFQTKILFCINFDIKINGINISNEHNSKDFRIDSEFCIFQLWAVLVWWKHFWRLHLLFNVRNWANLFFITLLLLELRQINNILIAKKKMKKENNKRNQLWTLYNNKWRTSIQPGVKIYFIAVSVYNEPYLSFFSL